MTIFNRRHFFIKRLTVIWCFFLALNLSASSEQKIFNENSDIFISEDNLKKNETETLDNIQLSTNESKISTKESENIEFSNEKKSNSTDSINSEKTQLNESTFIEFSEAETEIKPETIETVESIETTEQKEANNQKVEENLIKTVPRKELDIPLVEHKLVEKYIKEFQKPYNLKWLTKILKSAAPYRIYIRQQLELHNMPLCLEYLPVIESEYKTNAKSKSGALGIWQFMENSIYPFLSKNEWIDERLDPWKATEAAIKKLQDNYKQFNNWELALAAYNYGAGGIRRVIKKAKNNDYWYLVDNNFLTNQTTHYVPKFLAVAELITNAEYYGLDLPKATEADLILWDEVTVFKSIPLPTLSKEMNLDLSILKYLNPSLLRGRTPPATKYTLRVPVGTKDEVNAIVKNMQLPTYEHTYKVVKGDTLWGISRKYGLSVEDLCDANNISENAILSIGKILYVPIIE